MIDGHVNDSLQPIIEINLKRGETITTIHAVVDTGFSGEVCLAGKHVDQMEMAYEFAEPYELANGEISVEDVFGGVLVFDGRERDVHLILTDSDDTLVGAALLTPQKLTIDYAAQTVRIE